MPAGWCVRRRGRRMRLRRRYSFIPRPGEPVVRHRDVEVLPHLSSGSTLSRRPEIVSLPLCRLALVPARLPPGCRSDRTDILLGGLQQRIDSIRDLRCRLAKPGDGPVGCISDSFLASFGPWQPPSANSLVTVDAFSSFAGIMSGSPSRSCTSALLIRIVSGIPSTLTAMRRLRPLIFLPES